ncbi:MAG: HAD family hydrolase [Anaerolineales bacterium]|nr:HAD family hydrolase [Anaerolineales bacterium]
MQSDENKTDSLDSERLVQLVQNFYPELGSAERPQAPSLIQGVIFDLDDTLARLMRPIEELMAEGARAADAYMRAAGMDLPENFDANIVEARHFAEEKSAEENEEHLADDALSFLLQFFGYPASRMDPTVLRTAVDLFYAPEMTAWVLAPDALSMLSSLRNAGYRLALLANHNCDRVFQRAIDYLGIRNYFDVCLSSASVEYRKPDSRFLNIVVERWGAMPHEVIVVGDSIAQDVRAGLALGAWTILVSSGVAPQVAHDNLRFAQEFPPDATIDALSEIPGLVQTWST